jgi:hypothetical protein
MWPTPSVGENPTFRDQGLASTLPGARHITRRFPSVIHRTRRAKYAAECQTPTLTPTSASCEPDSAVDFFETLFRHPDERTDAHD